MICKVCGERMCGDGYSQVIHCPNNTDEQIDCIEPDANPVFCSDTKSIEIGQPIIWMGNSCVVESIIPHDDGTTEIGIALNGRVYYDWLSEVEIVEEEKDNG